MKLRVFMKSRFRFQKQGCLVQDSGHYGIATNWAKLEILNFEEKIYPSIFYFTVRVHYITTIFLLLYLCSY